MYNELGTLVPNAWHHRCLNKQHGDVENWVYRAKTVWKS